MEVENTFHKAMAMELPLCLISDLYYIGGVIKLIPMITTLPFVSYGGAQPKADFIGHITSYI